MTRWIKYVAVDAPIVPVALAVLFFFASLFAIAARLEAKRQTYFSDTTLTRQISYCYFKGEYHPKDPKHRKELWFKDGYLPCYFIPHRENI
jgi:hypothetical protein